MDKKEYAKQRLKERTASKRFKLPEGETTFRVLPNKKGDKYNDFFEYGMHSNVGPQNRYLRCGKNSKGEGECWLCDKVAVLSGSKKSSHRAAAEKMARVEKFATQIATISDGKWFGPTLWEMPGGVANGLLGVFHRKNVCDLLKGYNLTVERVGTTFKGTKYGSLLVDDAPSKVPSGIVAKMKTFSELVPKYDEAKLKSAYYGHEQDEEEEEAKKPVEEEGEEAVEEETRPGKRTAKKPAREEEEEGEADVSDEEFEALEEESTEEEEEALSGEEEEETRPSKKPVGKKPVKKARSEEQDEEPIEEEPIDEEEPIEEEPIEEEPIEEEPIEEEEHHKTKPKPGSGKKPLRKPARHEED